MAFRILIGKSERPVFPDSSNCRDGKRRLDGSLVFLSLTFCYSIQSCFPVLTFYLEQMVRASQGSPVDP